MMQRKNVMEQELQPELRNDFGVLTPKLGRVL